MLTSTLIGLCVVAICGAREVNNCTNAYVRNNFKYEKEILKDGLNRPYQLAYNYNENTLFFSYSNEAENVSDDFKSAYINLKSNEFGIISGIDGGFANAVDNENNKVYLGGSNGIYTFDPESKTAQYFAANSSNIWQMFYKEKLYFTTTDEKAFTLEDGVPKEIPQLSRIQAAMVAVDKSDNLFFSSSSGLFKVVKEGFEYQDQYQSIDFINGFTADANGKLYFSTSNNFWVIDDTNDTIETIFSKIKRDRDNSVYGIAIVGDDIIVSSTNGLFKIKKTDQVCDE